MTHTGLAAQIVGGLRRRPTSVALLAVAVGVGVSTVSARPLVQRVAPRGIYAAEQASRGERVYRSVCQGCHGRNLDGSEQGPRLVGEAFLKQWEGEALVELLAFVADTMPQGDPGGLTDEEYQDVLAFVLQMNDFPSGQELRADSTVEIVVDRGP